MEGPGVTVRMERPGEEHISRAIIAEAFRDDKTPPLVDELRKSTAWRDLSFYGVVEGEPVAHLCYTRGWVDSPTRLIEVLILSPMSVRPEWQRRGIGTRLIKESLLSL